VNGWETVLAAVGGLVLGLGLGLGWGLRGQRRVARQLRQAHSRVRSVILPVLESRADTLGLGRSQGAVSGADPLEQAAELSTRIEKRESSQHLAYSDTVQLDRDDLRGEDEGA